MEKVATKQALQKSRSSSLGEIDTVNVQSGVSASTSHGKCNRTITPKGSSQCLFRQEPSTVPSRQSSRTDLKGGQANVTTQLSSLAKSCKSSVIAQDKPNQRYVSIPSPEAPSTRSINPFLSLPLELQSEILPYLPYRSLLALRLSCQHFSSDLVPLPVLRALRKSIIATSLAYERETITNILNVPGLKSRWNRFWYQDPFYLDYLLWKLEQNEHNLSVVSFKAMEQLRCYTCLEMKGAFNGDYARKFSARSRGLGGTRAEARMCKDCMMRKCISGLHGRWWREAYWRENDIVRVRQPHFPGKLKNLIRGKPRTPSDSSISQSFREHGVCAKCRSECDALYWGCAACFSQEQKSRQAWDKIGMSLHKRKVYDMKICMTELNRAWYKYSGLYATRHARWSFYGFRHAFDPRKLKYLRNLIGGKDFWLYLEWKARQRRYERNQEQQDLSEMSVPPHEWVFDDDMIPVQQTINAQDVLQQEAEDLTLVPAAGSPAKNNSQPASSLTTLPASASTDSSSSPSWSSWSPYPSFVPRCKNFEIRCADCWTYNRRISWLSAAVYETTKIDHLCHDCSEEVMEATSRAHARKVAADGSECGIEGLANLFGSA